MPKAPACPFNPGALPAVVLLTNGDFGVAQLGHCHISLWRNLAGWHGCRQPQKKADAYAPAP